MLRRYIFLGWVLIIMPFICFGAHLERSQARELIDFQFIQKEKGSGKEIGEWMSAKVPGDVITDLVRAGKIAHPYYDFNSNNLLWVNNCNWLYRTDFLADLEPGERLWVLFRGIDYQSQIRLNGEKNFDHIGMFSYIWVDGTDLVKEGQENQLEVLLFGLGNIPFSKISALDILSSEEKRRKLTKTQMSFGWDFAPRLIGAGIWDKVELFKTGPVAIQDLGIRAKNSGEVELEVELDSTKAGLGIIKIEVFPENFGDKKPVLAQNFPVNLKPGKSGHNLKFQISNPKLWWSFDLGEPNVYRLKMEIVIEDKLSDRVDETFGFREISWEQNPDAQEGWNWVLKLNGKRVFLRGANWVPPEALFGQLSEDRYEDLIKLAREANINIFRIWGGGNREREVFYELADKAGIMLWQEFPFACIFTLNYPTEQSFLNLVEQEVSEIVRSTRNHPSVILYSGGNEFDVKRNKKLVERMRSAVKRYDPGTRFIPASPAEGDSHNWLVWHQKGNLEDYFSDSHALMSEFGLQAFPGLETLEKYMAPELIWPIGKAHIHHNLGQKKMMKYLSAIPHPETLEGYIFASQKMQAYYYQRAIEHWRIRKYRYSGTLFWQFNEPWPAICWSVIDYELNPKLSYERIKDSYNPLLVSADLELRRWSPEENFSTELYLVNDYHQKFSDLKISAYINGELIARFSADVEPDSVLKLGAIKTQLPSESPLELELFVKKDGKVLSKNYYELEIYDPKPAGRTAHKLYQLYKQVFWGEEKEKK